jgi:hypothetical protein
MLVRGHLNYANSLLASDKFPVLPIKSPVPISRELSSNKLILLRSVGQILAQRPPSWQAISRLSEPEVNRPKVSLASQVEIFEKIGAVSGFPEISFFS